MTTSTRPKRIEALHFGSAILNLIDCTEDNVNDVNFITPKDSYIGAMTDLTLTITRTFRDEYTFTDEGVKVLKDTVLVSEVVNLSLSFLEITQANTDIALGLNSSMGYMRAEIISASYLSSTVKIILPKIKNTIDAIKIQLINVENPLEIPMNFSVASPNPLIWSNPSWGKITVPI